MGTTLSTMTDTLYYTIDTSRVGRRRRAKHNPRRSEKQFTERSAEMMPNSNVSRKQPRRPQRRVPE
jgi:hypothetical protein